MLRVRLEYDHVARYLLVSSEIHDVADAYIPTWDLQRKQRTHATCTSDASVFNRQVSSTTPLPLVCNHMGNCGGKALSTPAALSASPRRK